MRLLANRSAAEARPPARQLESTWCCPSVQPKSWAKTSSSIRLLAPWTLCRCACPRPRSSSLVHLPLGAPLHSYNSAQLVSGILECG